MKKHKLTTLFHFTYFNEMNKQPHIFKNRIIKKLRIHRYVDDDLDLLEYLLSKNRQTIFFWFNKKHNGLLKHNLFAITKLSSILT